MYLSYWNLDRPPFDYRVDPHTFYASVQHQRILQQLRDMVMRPCGCTALIGMSGVGKSALAATLAECTRSMEHSAVCVPAFSRLNDQLEEVLCEFARDDPSQRPIAPRADNHRNRLDALAAAIDDMRHHGRLVTIILDDVGCLPDCELLGLELLITELCNDSSPRTSLILIAPSDFSMRVDTQKLTKLSSIPRFVLGPMRSHETAGYISHRMRRAGGDPTTFAAAAVPLIHDLTGGIPRRINRLCDLCLFVAAASQAEQVDSGHVWQAQQEAQLLSSTCSATMPRPFGWRPLRRSKQPA